MKSIKKIVALSLLLGCWLLVIPLHISAQSIEVDPLSLDFGVVGLGEELTEIITITSLVSIPLTVESLTIVDDINSSFYFLSDPPPPAITLLNPGDWLDVTIGFSPSSLGFHTASIRIESNAEPPDALLFVSLQGSTVSVPDAATIFLLAPSLIGLVGSGRRFKN